MALRRFMHPRNKYREGSDFRKLAAMYPDFREHTTTDLAGKLRYNFKNEESLRILAKTLLKHDFQLEVEIPKEKLVPAMPLRLNYVLWIEDLLEYANISQAKEIHGIDIGTGAVCIYPLLCAKIYGWRMTATELSESSVSSAIGNVRKNNLNGLIKGNVIAKRLSPSGGQSYNWLSLDNVQNEKLIFLVSKQPVARTVIRVAKENALLAEALGETEHYSFTMCNPPFFADESQKKDKRLPPRNAATGNATELLAEGGERQFVTRLIDESFSIQNRVKIYTTMLGQKSSCAYFRSELKKRNIVNATWTEFCQGHTKRWGLAWSHLPKQDLDLANAPVIRTRNDASTIKQPKDRPSETVFPLTEKFPTLDELIALLKQWLREMKIEMRELDLTDKEFDGWTCRLKAYEDSWSHARRKRRMARQQEKSAKRPRLENPESEKSDDCADFTTKDVSLNNLSVTRPAEPLLECSLTVGELEIEDDADEDDDGDLVKMCIIFESGRGGKHALETFRQYLINKLNIREYLRNRSRAKSPKRKKRRGKKSIASDRTAE